MRSARSWRAARWRRDRWPFSAAATAPGEAAAPPGQLAALRQRIRDASAAARATLRRTAGRLSGPPLRQLRIEAFGAIVQLRRPRALVFVDRTLARRLGVQDGEAAALWRDLAADGAVGRAPLSAPLEAHLQLTNRCSAGCRGCYTGAVATAGAGEWGLAEWRRALDELAAMGVFHVALGGGESATLPWLGEVAAHARARGIVPNLTTSGLTDLDRVLACAELFGQINVSLDGLGETYRRVRGIDGFAAADAALRALRRRKREIGINVVVTRDNFAELPALFAHARRRRLNEVELLRFKPAGRGQKSFAALTCTDEQHRRFLPLVLAASRAHRMRTRVDCSYTPMIAHHRPDPELLRRLTVYGCTAGDFLVGARSNGTLVACSFAGPDPGRPKVDEIRYHWRRPEAFAPYRSWRQAAEPCRSCSYLPLCRGGCKVVSAHLKGDPTAPDPECPRVVDWRAGPAAPGRTGRRASLPVVM